jgi:hypothetical protein
MNGWAASPERIKRMNCQQFQEILPHIIESGGDAEQESHLQTCQACSDLVRDLKYIAEQAKLLLPMRDPSPKVWTSIEDSLQREGLIREGRMSRQGHIMTIHPTQTKSWTPLGLALAATAVIVLGIVLFNYHPSATLQANNNPQTINSPAASDSDDQVILNQVAQQQPDVRQAYEDSLKQVNAYIADAKKAVKDDPHDAAAQEHLMAAYQQKAMLYHMATARSLP